MSRLPALGPGACARASFRASLLGLFCVSSIALRPRISCLLFDASRPSSPDCISVPLLRSPVASLGSALLAPAPPASPVSPRPTLGPPIGAHGLLLCPSCRRFSTVGCSSPQRVPGYLSDSPLRSQTHVLRTSRFGALPQRVQCLGIPPLYSPWRLVPEYELPIEEVHEV